MLVTTTTTKYGKAIGPVLEEMHQEQKLAVVNYKWLLDCFSCYKVLPFHLSQYSVMQRRR